MKISNYNFSTKKYGKNSTKPEDYDFKGFGDSLVSNAMNRLSEAKSPAPQVSFETDTFDSIYGNTNFSNTNSDFLIKSEPVATLNEGARIKNDVYEVLKATHPETEIKGVFDNIPDEDVERNIPQAEKLIQSIGKNDNEFSRSLNRYPTMQDGLSLYLAAGERGDKKATNLAHEAAYTKLNNPVLKKDESKVKTFFSNIFGGKKESNETNEEKQSFEPDVYKDNTKNDSSTPESTKLNPYGVFDVFEDQVLPSNDLFDIFENIKNGDSVSAKIDVKRNISSLRSFYESLKDNARLVWKAGSELYLKPKGLTVSAGMLEHSLQEKPADVVFYEDSDVVKKIMSDNEFLTHLDEVVYKVENKIPLTKEDKHHNFEANDNQDLYYSIHGCQFEIYNISYNKDETKDISVHITDNYDYTKIWTSMEGEKFSPFRISLGTLANDFGTITSKLDAINPYKVDIYFTIRR